MDYSRLLLSSDVKKKPETLYLDMGSNSHQHMTHGYNSDRSQRHHSSRGHSLEYDELDLVSECSTPVNYTPGRYLQLCGLSPDLDKDVTLWPAPDRPSPSDVAVKSLFPSHQQDHHYNMTSRKLQVRLTGPRLVITMAICVVVALTALGGILTLT